MNTTIVSIESAGTFWRAHTAIGTKVSIFDTDAYKFHVQGVELPKRGAIDVNVRVELGRNWNNKFWVIDRVHGDAALVLGKFLRTNDAIWHNERWNVIDVVTMPPANADMKLIFVDGSELSIKKYAGQWTRAGYGVKLQHEARTYATDYEFGWQPYF